MNRRHVIAGLAGTISGLRAGLLRAAGPEGEPAAKSCRLITQDLTGPYYVDGRPLRSDITEGLPGIPLQLDFEVVDTFGCQPLAGALVGIWHSSADGFYSGVRNLVLDAEGDPVEGGIDLSHKTFLRGFQATDASGRASFRTIVPGWYFPRPPHIHLVVYPPDFGEKAVTQLYFREEIADRIYRREPYASRGPTPDLGKSGDASRIDRYGAEDLWLELRESGVGFIATHRLGVTFYGAAFGTLPDSYRQG